ncbi:MAG: hypothetical protein U1F65_01580 [Verrucomicrobiota bacterium]
MKTNFSSGRNAVAAGYALLIVLGMTAASALILSGTLRRTYTVSKLNDRNNQYSLTLNAAEAACEKVYARICYDFSTPGLALGAVTSNTASGLYANYIPSSSENSYWTNFVFSDAQGHDNKVYVQYLTSYSGNLPSQFTSGGTNLLATLNAPVYRIVANARMKNARHNLTNAVQEDVLLAMVPLSTRALFSNTNMEFVRCAPLTVNGTVHANGHIFTGCLSSSTLNFNSQVTCVGVTLKTNLDGLSLSSLSGAVNYNGGKLTNNPPVVLSLNMTNTHMLIDVPPSGEDPNSTDGQQRLYNKAQVVLTVSNSTVTMKIRNGTLPGADASPVTITATNLTTDLAKKFYFLSTNAFTDQRESRTVLATQVDMGKYKNWLSTNASISSKFPTGSGSYPTILFVDDNRTVSGSQFTAIRVTNGIALPDNGGLGFTLATPDPLYVWGHYNSSSNGVPINLGTTNTTWAVPSALMSDALTVLSPSWQDSHSNDAYSSGVRVASSTTINAAVLTGLVYSTGNSSTTYSGGIYNMPRLLEDWGNGGAVTLTLNTSLINLFQSKVATHQWQDPGSYYNAPTRKFSFDMNFFNPAKQPPGMPCALMPVRFNYCAPPPNTVTYNVTP